MRMLREDTVPCAVRLGSPSPVLVELFERVVGEPFTDVPGSLLTSRIKSLGRVLREVMQQHGASFAPPLQTAKKRDYIVLNRVPRVPCPDVLAWRRRVQEAEKYQAAPLRTRQMMTAQDRHLAGWVHGHRYLRPVDVQSGESGMALLLLWEVDHQQSWPTTSSERAGVLSGFTKRLSQQVAQHDELKAWFIPRELQRPLAPGLPDCHHFFWPVQVVPPPPTDPQGWYQDFVSRWRAYLATLATPLGVAVGCVPSRTPTPPTEEVLDDDQGGLSPFDDSAEDSRRPRSSSVNGGPAKRKRAVPPTRQAPVPAFQQRVRPREDSATASQAKRQCDIRSFFHPPPAQSDAHGDETTPQQQPCRHGRAQQGPPT